MANIWEVDIIGLSFGLSYQIAGLDGLRKAIKDVYSKDIVIFAAAANHGAMDDVTFPANLPKVICVNSADGDGNRSPFNPPIKREGSISALGEAIPASWHDGP